MQTYGWHRSGHRPASQQHIDRRNSAVRRSARTSEISVFRTSPGQLLRGWDERRQAIAQAVDKAGRTRDLLADNGIDCPDITGAGTGSFEFEAASAVYTELQCGSYIFMDADYGRNRDRDGEPTKAFEPSLFVWATVMSRPAEDRAIEIGRAHV